MSHTEPSGAIAQIINFSLVDGPGNRLAVFLQGCYFNCLYCHNPETIPLPGKTAEPSSYTLMSVQEVVERYQRAKPFLSGVTFSGGECTIQIEFLLAVCAALKAQGAHILIDTNGQLGGEKLEHLFGITDGLMLDMKTIGLDEHKALTGVSNEAVKNCFYAALACDKLSEVRTVIRGAAPDALETVAWVAKELAAHNAAVTYRLIRYRPHGVRPEMLERLEVPSEALMQQCRDIALATGLQHVLIT